MIRWYRNLRRRLAIADLAEKIWRQHGRLEVRRGIGLGAEPDLLRAMLLAALTTSMQSVMDDAARKAFQSSGIDIKEYGRAVRYTPGKPRVNA